MSKYSALNIASVSDLITGLWGHLSGKRKRQYAVLCILMVFCAVAETVSLGFVIPFLGALADPEAILGHPVVSAIAPFFGIRTSEQVPLRLAILFSLLAIFSAAIRMLLLWVNTKLSYAVGGDFSVACYRKTLHQPYDVHLGRNSSVVLSTISKKVGVAIAVLYQLTTLLGSLVISGAVISALIFIEWRIALCAGGVLAFIYLLVVRYVRSTLYGNSLWASQQEDRAVQILQEGLGGIRDVLLDGTQDTYANKYSNVVYILRQRQATNVFLAGAPRYLLEAIGMVTIAIVAGVLAADGGKATFASVFPMLGAFALGAQRLLPTLQQIYSAWAGVVGNHGAVADVLAMLDQQSPARHLSEQWKDERLSMSTIVFQNVSYRYSPDAPWVLKNVDITIQQGTRLGVVGGTGCGKSTLLDILMGLLRPTTGEVLINGVPIGGGNTSLWQQTIAHVPQNIFLADASIAENIAFGVSKKKIDLDRVKQAASLAQIAEFVEAGPEGYWAFVGERGVRLSGGQIQRIGLARAFYKQASVLILDEATSALDTETENLVMQTMEQLDRALTLIIVAHRVSTLKGCDHIIELVDGRLVSYESYGAYVSAKKHSNAGEGFH